MKIPLDCLENNAGYFGFQQPRSPSNFSPIHQLEGSNEKVFMNMGLINSPTFGIMFAFRIFEGGGKSGIPLEFV